ncbi:DUF742 domain-containing protein [Streptomyces longisporoflavus]|uniref:DUF742 domain-containing protein n=1 Tax=Streptomyces longisporoflavus TaxID=28044 RepID=A0ABW7R5I7_9ACTN
MSDSRAAAETPFVSHSNESDLPASAEAPFASHGGAGGPIAGRAHAAPHGRTRPRYQLAVEALVHTIAQPGQLAGLLPEHRRICELCTEVKSVAEVSALLQLPLGVARILVADLAEASLVALHQPGGADPAYRPETALLERVLSGLRQPPSTQQASTAAPSSAVPDPAPPQEEPIRDLAPKTAPEHDLPAGLQQLLQDVSGVVDVEAGLREALLQSRYVDAMQDLGAAVDLEAGLRDALTHRPDPDA